MKHKIDPVATLALTGSILCWSTVPIFLKYFTSFIDGWVANGMRYPFAALLYIPWLIAFRRAGKLSRHAWKLALLPASINIVSQILWAWTPYFINPGLIAFLVRLSTLWTVLGSFILFKDERALVRSWMFWAGFFFAICGFIMMALGTHHSFGKATVTGIVLVLLTSIGWAGYQLSVRRNMQNIDSRVAFGMISFLTSIGLLSCMFIFGDTNRAVQMPLHVTVLVFLSGLIGIAAAHLLFYIAIKRIGIAIASSANLASAFLTAAFSRFLFHETLTSLQWLAGAGLIIGGILLTRSQVHVRIVSKKQL